MSDGSGELVVNGARIVRIRPVTVPMGLGMRLRMFEVTNTRDRRRIGPRHISREAAARWVDGQGWRYIGSQVSR